NTMSQQHHHPSLCHSFRKLRLKKQPTPILNAVSSNGPHLHSRLPPSPKKIKQNYPFRTKSQPVKTFNIYLTDKRNTDKRNTFTSSRLNTKISNSIKKLWEEEKVENKIDYQLKSIKAREVNVNYYQHV
ncbi:hypothetical protein HDU92_001460, partial [Lobulomyces angularis]